MGLVALVGLVYGGILVWTKVINPPEDALDTSDLSARVTATTVATASTTSPPTTPDAPTSPDVEDPPASNSPATNDAEPGGVEGRWVIGEGTELGYRVPEILGGVDTEGVGRTSQVTGALEIAATRVVTADFVVDVASIRSDSGQRDGQFRGRIMDTATHPTASFRLDEPIELGEIPEPGRQITATATGTLTLRGVSRSVTFEVTAERGLERLGVLGRIPVVFAEYEIPNPSNSFVSTGDEGEIEFVLVFTPQS